MHEIHPPKVELFDVAAMTNTDPKGFVRAVDTYQTTEFGLYMARPVPGHPRLRYFRSWLLPGVGMRVSRWQGHPDTPLDHDYYLDVCDIEPNSGQDTTPVWRTTDLYLDVLVRTGRDLRVLDTDEILAARSAGLLDDNAVRRAFDRTLAAVDGIASAGYEVDTWLAGRGIPVIWTPL